MWKPLLAVSLTTSLVAATAAGGTGDGVVVELWLGWLATFAAVALWVSRELHDGAHAPAPLAIRSAKPPGGAGPSA
jgi:hypothetical protein